MIAGKATPGPVYSARNHGDKCDAVLLCFDSPLLSFLFAALMRRPS